MASEPNVATDQRPLNRRCSHLRHLPCVHRVHRCTYPPLYRTFRLLLAHRQGVQRYTDVHDVHREHRQSRISGYVVGRSAPPWVIVLRVVIGRRQVPPQRGRLGISLWLWGDIRDIGGCFTPRIKIFVIFLRMGRGFGYPPISLISPHGLFGGILMGSARLDQSPLLGFVRLRLAAATGLGNAVLTDYTVALPGQY